MPRKLPLARTGGKRTTRSRGSRRTRQRTYLWSISTSRPRATQGRRRDRRRRPRQPHRPGRVCRCCPVVAAACRTARAAVTYTCERGSGLNACSFACRMLPYHVHCGTLGHAEEACEQLERGMQRGNPFLHHYLICSECAELCRDCECGHCWPVHCPDFRKTSPGWEVALWNQDNYGCACILAQKLPA